MKLLGLPLKNPLVGLKIQLLVWVHSSPLVIILLLYAAYTSYSEEEVGSISQLAILFFEIII